MEEITKFKLNPYPHQLHAMKMAREFNDVGLFHEMGTGKTGSAINMLRQEYAKQGRLMRTLIISPLVTLYNWQEEFGIHSYINKKDINVLTGSSKNKIKTFIAKAMDPATKEMNRSGIFITNYESCISKNLNDHLLEWQPEIIILDEAHYIKNPKAKRSKSIIKLGDLAKRRFILTGTPILNNVLDIFNLYRFLDKGETFGKNYYVFVNKYMEDENAAWAGQKGHFQKLAARTETFAELTDKIYTKGHRVLKKDVIKDLPPLVTTTRLVELGPEQRRYYKEMERDFITFVEDKERAGEAPAVVAQLAVTKALRLQQICAGYVSTEDGVEIEIEDNPRKTETQHLLQEIVLQGKHQVILWCSFRNNYKTLGRLCEQMGISHTFLTGDMNLHQKRTAMEEFNAGEKSVIIANRRAGGIGVNLIAAAYSIVYSRNFSLSEELQSEARNHRGGSQIHESIFKINLAARGTIDEKVLEALSNKHDISKQIIDVIRSK